MKRNYLAVAFCLCGALLPCFAAELRQGTVVQAVNDVKIVPTQGTEKDAHNSDVVQAPEKVRTGAKSRAELQAPDKTLTRIGANTIFSFEPAGRTLNLERGSVLFHSPPGRGGGTIKTAGASAAVLGTTLIVAATPDGGFKCVLLEGKGKIVLPNGKTQMIEAGDLIYVPTGGQAFGAVVKIDLGKLVSGSQLVNGFTDRLPSMGAIQNEIAKQHIAIISGNYEETGIMIGSIGTANDPVTIDPLLQQNTTQPPVIIRPKVVNDRLVRSGTVTIGYETFPYTIPFGKAR